MKLSIRASKLTSDKPAYKGKEKSESGNTIYRYDEKHIEKRWKLKKETLKKLEKGIEKVRTQYKKDLKSDDERTRAIAAIVALMDETAVRIGNEDSVKEHESYGATTLKKKHVKSKGNKITFDFVGKDQVKQDIELSNADAVKVVKELIKNKKAEDFIFEVDGKKIWDRAVNRYLQPLGISAKDIRGFHANRLMKEVLKKKDFKEALEEVAEIVGHKPATLKNQYLDPDLVEKYDGKEKKNDKKSKAALSIRAAMPFAGPEFVSIPAETYLTTTEDVNRYGVDLNRNVSNIVDRARLSPIIIEAWKIIAPFLPVGAQISSGHRDLKAQTKTIWNYWNRKYWGKRPAGGKGFFVDNYPQYGRTIEDMRKFMTEQYNPTPEDIAKGGPRGRLSIAPPGMSKHQTGNAFDVDRLPSYEKAEKIIHWIGRNLAPFIHFTEILSEGPQKALHIAVDRATYPGPQNMLAYLNKFYYGIKSQQKYISQHYIPQFSKKAEDANTLQLIQRLQNKYFGAPLSNRSVSNNSGINPGVKTNETIISAWNYLKPHLPPGAVMTSGARTPQDQIRIINNYWNKSGLNNKYPQVQDPFQRSRLLIQNGWVVGPPDAQGKQYVHLTGNAFDISGANLNEIAEAARRVSQDPNIPVQFAQILVEPKNNAVHIGVQSVGPRPVQMEMLADTEEDMIKTAQDVLEDLIASDAPDEIINEYKDILAGNVFENVLRQNSPDTDEDSGIQLPFLTKSRPPKKKVSEQDAENLSYINPTSFFSLGLHREFPQFERSALKNILSINPKFYFIFRYDQREEFADLLPDAAVALMEQSPKSFFDFGLDELFPELAKEIKSMSSRSFNQLSKRAVFGDYKINKQDIKRIYELEYKISQLNLRPELTDTTNIHKMRMEVELKGLLDKVINSLRILYREWIEANSELRLPQTKNIIKIYKELLNYQPKSLSDGIILFHKALTTVHSTGKMSIFMFKEQDIELDEDFNERFLSDLSKDKFVPQWDNELKKLAAFEPSDLGTQDIKLIYELEYKIDQLNRRKELSDIANIQKMKMEAELQKLLDKTLNIMEDIFKYWLGHHSWDNITARNIKRVYEELINNQSNDLKNKIVLFHKALTTVHHTGKMTDYLDTVMKDRSYLKPGTDLNTILNDLSSGTEINKWDEDLKKYAAGLGPIAPMRLKKTEDPEKILDEHKVENIVLQYKFDGWKTMCIKDSKGVVKIYSRRGDSVEANIPDLVKELEDKLDSGDFILGELTYFKDNKQSISDVQTIAGSSPENAQKFLKEHKGKLVLQAYDLLWNNGKDITKTPYIDRYNKLKKQIGKSELIKVPDNYSWGEKDKAMKDALAIGSEGLVIKLKDGEYKYAEKGSNEPVGEQWKWKPKGKTSNKDEVILDKYHKGEKGAKLIFPMYQYDGSKLVEVGQISGMPKEEESRIKKDIDAGKKVVIEISYQERNPETKKFRHSGYSRIRSDKPAKEVKLAYLSRRAGMLGFPKKMYWNVWGAFIDSWSFLKNNKSECFKAKVPVNISDIPQYDLDWVRNGLDKLQSDGKFKEIYVQVCLDEDAGAVYDKDNKGIIIYYNSDFNSPKYVDSYDYQHVIEHELTHLVQDIMDNILADQGKSTLTGLPGNYNPDKYYLYDSSSAVPNEAKHTSSDVEFYPILRQIVYKLNGELKIDFPIHDEAELFDLDESDHIPQDIWPKILYHRFNRWIKKDQALNYWAKNEPDKYKKAISILYKEVYEKYKNKQND